MEDHEEYFIKQLKIIWKAYLTKQYLDIPQDKSKEFELINFYGKIFRDFLRMDTESIEGIFKRKFNEELVNYFFDHYEPQKLFIFIALVIHLVLEEDFNLLPILSEPTGRVCGVWKTGEINTGEEALSRLIERRVQYSLAKEDYARFYFSEYKCPSDPLVKRLLYEDHIKVEKEMTLPEKKAQEEETLLKKLVGTTAATTILSFLGRWLGKKLGMLKIWLSSDPSVQSMVSIGCVAGSLKFYGFCIERHKKGPTRGVRYKVSYQDELPDYLIEAYNRIPIFFRFLKHFASIGDKELLKILEKDDGKEKTWWILQKVLWLIIQPYCKNKEEKKEVWDEFIMQIDFDNLLQSEGPLGTLFRLLMDEISEEQKVIDYEKFMLTKKALEIIEKYNIEIHPENEEILLDIKRKIKKFNNVD